MNRFKELRENMHITQKELAKLLFIKQQSINNYETGKNLPDISILKRMAKYYNVSIDYLLEETDIKAPASTIQSNILTDSESSVIHFYRALPQQLQKDIHKIVITINDYKKNESNP